MHRSGLAERLSVYLIRFAKGNPKLLYVQMLAAFAGLTFALPSASTRGAIMVHVYEQVMERWGVQKTDPLNKAVMMAMGGLNRLGSTALLAGGITPVVASALIADFGGVSDFSWTRWFILMAVPFYLILIFGGILVYFMFRSGFTLPDGANTAALEPGPIQGKEIRAGLIAIGTALVHRLCARSATGGACPHRHDGDSATGNWPAHLARIRDQHGLDQFLCHCFVVVFGQRADRQWGSCVVRSHLGGKRGRPARPSDFDTACHVWRSRIGARRDAQHIGLSVVHHPGGHVYRCGAGP